MRGLRGPHGPRIGRRPRRGTVVYALALIAVAATAACGSAPADGAVGQSGVAAESPALSPTQVLALWLDASRLDGDRAALDSLDCDPRRDGGWPRLLLADGRPLESRPVTTGDIVTAEVVTVGEVDRDRAAPGRFVVRLRTRVDTLEWDAVPEPLFGRATICDGLAFGTMPADSLATWRPDGVTLAMLRATTDSIRRGRAVTP
jgi:hypothetical protein